MLIIKPSDIGLETKLAILTDKRTYHIKLISNKHGYMSMISFVYADTEDKKWKEYYQRFNPVVTNIKTNNPSNINFNYSVTGNESLKPLRICDNGDQVFIHTPKKMKELQALFIVNGNKKQLVNYRFVNDYFYVDQLFETAVLVLDVSLTSKQVVIKRNKWYE